MGRFDYTCKKCGRKISTDILPSDGICKDCRDCERTPQVLLICNVANKCPARLVCAHGSCHEENRDCKNTCTMCDFAECEVV